MKKVILYKKLILIPFFKNKNTSFLHALLSQVLLSGVLIDYPTPRCLHNRVTMHFAHPCVHYNKKAFKFFQPSSLVIA